MVPGISSTGRHCFFQAGFLADIFCVRAPEHTANRQAPDKVTVIVPDGGCEVFKGCGGVGCSQRIDSTGNYFPVFEPVVPEGLDDSIILFSQYDISFIEEFENEPINKVTFTDIKDQYTLKSVLVDGKHFSPGQVLAEKHGKLGRIFRGFRQVFYQMCPSPRLDNHLVSCLVLAIQPDAHRAGVKLVDLVYPERKLCGQIPRNRLNIDPAHSLFGCH